MEESKVLIRQKISDFLHKFLIYPLVISWIIIFISFFFISTNLRPYGLEMGNWAIRFLWLASIPGILKRFRVFGFLQDVQIVLMKSRRRIGDLMFTFAVMHYLWNKAFFLIKVNDYPGLLNLKLFEWLGFTGLLILIPLFLTSNNFSVRFLKVWWTRIHSSIYFAMWLIAFHVALQGLVVEAAMTFAIAILQITSWISYKSYLRQTTLKI